MPTTTPILLTAGEMSIKTELNNTESARVLLERLPCTLRLNRYEHDFCGVMEEPLPHETADIQSGWKNGDLSFALDGNYFAILYKGEEHYSQSYGNLVMVGHLRDDCAVMDQLPGTIELTIGLA